MQIFKHKYNKTCINCHGFDKINYVSCVGRSRIKVIIMLEIKRVTLEDKLIFSVLPQLVIYIYYCLLYRMGKYGRSHVYYNKSSVISNVVIPSSKSFVQIFWYCIFLFFYMFINLFAHTFDFICWFTFLSFGFRYGALVGGLWSASLLSLCIDIIPYH